MADGKKGTKESANKTGRSIKIYQRSAEKLRQLKYHRNENIIDIIDDLADKDLKKYTK